MRWYYQEIGLTRKEAEAKILNLGAMPSSTSRGWQLPSVKKSWRIHIIPSDTYMEIHEDTSLHTVHKGEQARQRCKEIHDKLNEYSKVKLFFKRLFN